MVRKHTKRHEKPYGCTFPRCDKRFGSKNDWKRHENSQHYKLEMWKCNEPSESAVGESCKKTFNRREHFKLHLAREHGIKDSAHVEFKLKDCLDARNYEVRFWCGFCEDMVQVKDKGSDAWVGRFNHIDNHFSGKMDISAWKSPAPGLQEVDVVPMPSSESGHSEFQKTASARAGNGGRTLKRGAGGEDQHSRPLKKARSSALWYCVSLSVKPSSRAMCVGTANFCSSPVRLRLPTAHGHECRVSHAKL